MKTLKCGHVLKKKFPTSFQLFGDAEYCDDCVVRSSMLCTGCGEKILPGQLVFINPYTHNESEPDAITVSCIDCEFLDNIWFTKNNVLVRVPSGYVSLKKTELVYRHDNESEDIVYLKTSTDEPQFDQDCLMYINENLSEQITQYFFYKTFRQTHWIKLLYDFIIGCGIKASIIPHQRFIDFIYLNTRKSLTQHPIVVLLTPTEASNEVLTIHCLNEMYTVDMEDPTSFDRLREILV